MAEDIETISFAHTSPIHAFPRSC